MSHSAQTRLLLQRIQNVFSNGPDHQLIDRHFGIGLSFEIAHWKVHVMAHAGGLIVASTLPLTVPPDRRAAMADLINRINNMTVSGFLEMHPDTGVLRLRHCVSAPPEVISCRIIREAVRHNCTMAQHSIPRLIEFLKDSLSPESVAGAWLADQAASENVAVTGQQKQSQRFHYPPRFNPN